MSLAWLKRSAPRSLYARAALILLLPVVTIQLVVGVVFIQRLFEDVSEQMTGNLAFELRRIEALIDAAPDAAAARDAFGPLAEALEIGAVLPDPAPVTADRRALYDLSGRLVIDTLRDAMPGLRGVDLQSDDGLVNLTLATSKGDLGLIFDRDRVSAQNPHQLLVLMVATSLLMTIVAYLFLKNQLRPIKRLSEAAAAFGRGRALPYRPSGATEVRAAGAAFLDMRNRLERQMEARTLMLSGVSHDLRTPLTRLKLGLSLIESEDAADLRRDVDEMAGMLDAFLDFARDGALGDPVEIDPATLLRETAADARRGGQPVELGPVAEAGQVVLRPLAIRRVLENLIGNAARHGSRVRVSLAAYDRSLVFTVEDDGPGIAEDQREVAMRPFTRLDAARNQDRGGGVGLGLAVAVDIARQHGGTLRLGSSEALGGLRADLVLAI
ncbi:HAMP domain-containing protein [Palleronia sediminis]|uniref:histidine kinase n=1 Tax=Palleronia sediminis TaxID=2547833 RepID=A0A4R6AA43_9RHOB|nr:ATP-binding protein [Palleronia sediminis]TDL78126.1 HAMP domain-containing protein [Palleronia sediminis]